MRNPELMLELLREMASNPRGEKMSTRTLGMSIEKQTERHHLDLLIDAGHAQWTSPQQSIARITNTGYDFLNAIDRGKGTKDRFVDLFNGGMPYLNAAREILSMVTG